MRLKITILKRMTNLDLVEAHMGPDCRGSRRFPCPVFEDDQVFVFDAWSGMPDGFCSSAWIDIQRQFQLVQSRGTYPVDWVVPMGAAIACCTDGYRPVVFRIERLGDDGEVEVSKAPN